MTMREEGRETGRGRKGRRREREGRGGQLGSTLVMAAVIRVCTRAQFLLTDAPQADRRLFTPGSCRPGLSRGSPSK